MVSWAGAQTWLQTTGGGNTQGFDSSSVAFLHFLSIVPQAVGDGRAREFGSKLLSNFLDHLCLSSDESCPVDERRALYTSRCSVVV